VKAVPAGRVKVSTTGVGDIAVKVWRPAVHVLAAELRIEESWA
jgi:hypothetical protein